MRRRCQMRRQLRAWQGSSWVRRRVTSHLPCRRVSASRFAPHPLPLNELAKEVASMLSKAARSLGLAGAGAALRQTLPAAGTALHTCRWGDRQGPREACWGLQQARWGRVGALPPTSGGERRRRRHPADRVRRPSPPPRRLHRRIMEAAQAQAQSKEDKRPAFPMARPRAGDPPKEARASRAGGGPAGWAVPAASGRGLQSHSHCLCPALPDPPAVRGPAQQVPGVAGQAVGRWAGRAGRGARRGSRGGGSS